MEQATQPTTPTASPESRGPDVERQEYQRASALMDRIVGQLTTLPRSAAVVGDLTGFRLQLNFGTNNPRGVLEFAATTDAPTLRDVDHDRVWFEARTTIEGIPVCAEVLLSPEAAAVFETQTPPPHPAPTGTLPVPATVVQPEPVIVPIEPATVPAPTPLGASVIAVTPAVQSPATAEADAL